MIAFLERLPVIANVLFISDNLLTHCIKKQSINMERC